ncbi:MAG: baseplate assembly protein [Chloroflexi bacterium]|nr:baseplate assembly protein [Chloroflexota bacterium]
MNSSRFTGKFRGTVSDNADPDGIGRLKVRIPEIFGDNDSGWAMPCVPYAGEGVGLFLIPPVGASVWVEFEQGNTEFPIWVGCFWNPSAVPGTSSTPAERGDPQQKVLKTDAGTITINDQTGEITIDISGAKVVLKSGGIDIDAGQGTINVNGSKVSINNGALEVS